MSGFLEGKATKNAIFMLRTLEDREIDFKHLYMCMLHCMTFDKSLLYDI